MILKFQACILLLALVGTSPLKFMTAALITVVQLFYQGWITLMGKGREVSSSSQQGRRYDRRHKVSLTPCMHSTLLAGNGVNSWTVAARLLSCSLQSLSLWWLSNSGHYVSTFWKMGTDFVNAVGCITLSLSWGQEKHYLPDEKELPATSVNRKIHLATSSLTAVLGLFFLGSSTVAPCKSENRAGSWVPLLSSYSTILQLYCKWGSFFFS